MRYACQTLFDITATGVTGHFKATRVPFFDRSGNSIADLESWNQARNKQRNFETLTQILGLRCQLTEVTDPVIDQTGTKWMFEFETETPGVYGTDDDPVAVLYSDADGVPMLTDLDNRRDITAFVVTQGPEQNIWFSPVTLNNS